MATAAVRFPFQLEFTEGTTAYGAYRVAHKQRLYADYSSPPFVTFGYPPVFYILTGTIARKAHQPVLKVGRLLSLFSGIGIGILIFWIGKSTLFSFFSAVAFLLNPFLLQELLLCEPNTMALLFGLLALAAALRGRRKMVFIFATLAFFTKPLFLALPLTSLFLVTRKSGKSEIFPIGVFFLFQTVLFLGLVMHTKGFAWDHLYLSHRQPFRFSQLFLFFTLHLRFLAPLLLLLLFVRGASLYFRLLFALSLVPILLSAKEGASPIYFAEALIGLHLLFAQGRVVPSSFRLGALACFSVLFALFFFRTTNMVYSFSQLSRSIVAEKMPLLTTIRSLSDQVLTEDADLSFLAGKPWIYEPFNTRALFLSGRRSAAPLQKMMKEGRISLVIAGKRLTSDPFLRPFLGHTFISIGKIGKFAIYRYLSDEKD